MLEIIIIVSLYQSLSGTAKAKGRSPYFGCLGPLLWLGFEVVGGFGAAVVIALNGGDPEKGIAVYASAVAFGILGGLLAWVLVRLVPPASIFCLACKEPLPHRPPDGVTEFQCASCGAILELRDGDVTDVK